MVGEYINLLVFLLPHVWRNLWEIHKTNKELTEAIRNV